MFNLIEVKYKGRDVVLRPPKVDKVDEKELYKKMLNYPSLGVLRGLDPEDLLSVKRHYMTMRDAFFGKEAPLENTKEDSEKFFNIEKWSALRSAVYLSQDYVRNIFFHELNLMRTQQFNRMINESEKTINNSTSKMNETYRNWVNSKGERLFDPIGIESMSENLQEALNKEKQEQDKGYVRTQVAPDPKHIKHYIRIK